MTIWPEENRGEIYPPKNLVCLSRDCPHTEGNRFVGKKKLEGDLSGVEHKRDVLPTSG